jgi:hypothetical protein
MTELLSLLVGGLLGTMVLTTVVEAASELGYTRMDLALMLGTIVTSNRRKARAIGYVFHFLIGFAFALLYGFVFVSLGQSSWWLGAVLGALHALFVSTVLVNGMLPIVHPRMATADTAANEVALIEPPGFLLLNYGRSTFALNLLAHIAYGAIIGASIRI